MKIEPKHLFIGVVVVVVIILLAAYKFIYAPYVEEAEKITKENVSLESRKADLNAKMANRTMYVEGIENSDKIIDRVLAKYGPGNTPEKTIMMIVDLCQKVGVTINNVSFSNDSEFYRSGSKTEDKDTLRILKSSTIAISMQGGYTQTKKFFDYINNYSERMNVNNFSTTYQRETGMLSSSIAVNLYSVEDKNHEYVAPVVENIDLGLQNIFTYTAPEIPEEEGEEGVDNAVTE